MKYEQLARLMKKLGFERHTIKKGTVVLFIHVPSETVILLPKMSPTSRIGQTHEVSIRFMLNAKGLLPAREWDAVYCNP